MKERIFGSRYAAAVASHGEWRKTGDDDEDDDDKQNDRDERLTCLI